jgi:hypothetical protein
LLVVVLVAGLDVGQQLFLVLVQGRDALLCARKITIERGKARTLDLLLA